MLLHHFLLISVLIHGHQQENVLTGTNRQSETEQRSCDWNTTESHTTSLTADDVLMCLDYSSGSLQQQISHYHSTLTVHYKKIL